eukprot:SAG31_NODE_38960_length_292_cov_0.533679_1_plen_68_part_10
MFISRGNLGGSNSLLKIKHKSYRDVGEPGRELWTGDPAPRCGVLTQVPGARITVFNTSSVLSTFFSVK